MKNIIFVCLRFIVLFGIVITSKAQIKVEDLKKAPKGLENGLYVLFNDTVSPVNKEYMDIFRKYWTYSKVFFVPKMYHEDCIKKGNYILSLHSNVFEKTYANNPTSYASAWSSGGTYYTYDLQIWTLKENAKSGAMYNGEIYRDNESKFIVANVNLFLNTLEFNRQYDAQSRIMAPALFYKDLNYGGLYENDVSMFYNLNKGFLINYLQNISTHLKNGKTENAWDDVALKDKLKELKTGTLYVPDFAINAYRYLKKGENIANWPKLDTKALFEDYKYQYEIITQDELSKKIINSDVPFYYLLFVVVDYCHYISIINSKTGEIVYFKYTSYEYPMIPKDIKKIIRFID